MNESRHGVFGVGPHLVAIPAVEVQEMFLLAETHRLPGLSARARGLTKLRDKALPTIDLRVCLGLTSAGAELEEMLQFLGDRERDHLAWLTELEASVREGRPFRLATDPRKCKFGQWYYAFETDNGVLRTELERIEQPHERIHALAHEVEALSASGRRDVALARLEAARRGLLVEVIRLFESTRQVLRQEHREVGVAVTLGGAPAVLVVDSAEAVVDIDEIATADDPLASGELHVDLIRRMGWWRGMPHPVMVLDLEKLTALREPTFDG
jgi:purine-binding chemotaxis protein CheW